MISYVIVLIGILLIIFGFYHLLKFISYLSALIKRLDFLMKDERFNKIETLKDELDELNYSYYELLDALNERVIRIERQIEISDSSNIKKNNKKEKNVIQTVKKPLDKTDKSSVQRLIAMGYNDVQIAKILNMGSGKVALIRQLYIDK